MTTSEIPDPALKKQHAIDEVVELINVYNMNFDVHGHADPRTVAAGQQRDDKMALLSGPDRQKAVFRGHGLE